MCEYEVTVLVLVYEPVKEKLLRTLYSAVMQKNVKMQIVVSDDGSRNNYFDEVKHFFESHEFRDYELYAKKKNEGTVANYYDSLPLCRGYYIKGISPGDMLYGENTLRGWIDDMNAGAVSLSFSNAVYYRNTEKGFVPVKHKACPQRIPESSHMEKIRRYLMIYDDIWLGAAGMVTRELLKEHISMIYRKVKYAEDHVFRLMCYTGEKIGYYDSVPLLYEYGSGISTSGNPGFMKSLKRDRKAADSILRQMNCPDGRLKKDFLKKLRLQMLMEKRMGESESSVGKKLVQTAFRIRRMLSLRGLFFFRVRNVFFPRYTPVNIDKNIADRLARMN